MPDYRLYFLTSENHIFRHHEFNGRDDLSAVIEAKAIGGIFAVEIWQEKRRVALVQPGCAPQIFDGGL